MAFSVSTRPALDGTGATITGGIVFIDESGLGTGPWIIAKSLIDPAGANVQFVLSNNAAKCDISSINGTATPTGHGTAAGALRVELPTDGTGLVNAAQSGTWNIGTLSTITNAVTVAQATAANLNATVTGTVAATQSGTWTVQQGGAPWSVTIPQSNITADYDTGAGVQTMTMWGLALPASGGAVAGGTATNPIRIDPTGTTTQPVSGTVTANAGTGTFTVSGTVTANQGGAPWAENITQFGGVALSTGTGASGTGIPRVTVANDSNILATQSGTWTVQQGTPPWTVNPGTAANWGIGATAATAPANAVQVGGAAMTTLPTAVTAGQLSEIAVDKFGRVVTLASSTRDNVAGSGVTTITSTTETTIIAAGAAGVFNDVHMILVSNTSATDVRVDIRDSTAGTIQFTFWAKGGTNTVGFSSTVPWPQTTAANNWTAQLSAAVTDVRISALFVKNK